MTIIVAAKAAMTHRTRLIGEPTFFPLRMLQIEAAVARASLLAGFAISCNKRCPADDQPLLASIRNSPQTKFMSSWVHDCRWAASSPRRPSN
jgi:hypothetical protein